MNKSKAIQIFRPGTFQPMEGPVLSFSEADLEAAARAYDPAVHEAPLVVGHPRNDNPAYGWVGALDFADGHLLALPDQVDPAFAELVNAGRFKHVSASFYSPDSASNPVPGVYYLRHVGFLGAQPPAVKGLKAASFSDGEAGVVTVQFGEAEWRFSWIVRSVASLFRRQREKLIESDGVEKANEVMPDWEIAELERAASDIAAEQRAAVPSPDFSETTPKSKEEPVADQTTLTADQLKEQADKLAADQAKLAADQAQFAEKQARAEAETYVAELVAKGRVTPAQQPGLISFMASLGDTDTVSFGEGDGAQKTPRQFMKDFLGALPVQVDFSERAPGGDGGDDKGLTADEISRRALEFQEAEAKAGREITAAAAVMHVVNKGDSK